MPRIPLPPAPAPLRTEGPKIFFPNAVFRFVRSPPGYAPNQAVFRVAPHMNKLDIRTYLERLYGVTVTNVRTANYSGTVKWTELLRNPKPVVRPEKRNAGLRPVRVPAYKRAIVTMTEDFRWPDPPDEEKAYSATLMMDFRKEQRAEKKQARTAKKDEAARLAKEAELEIVEKETQRLLAELNLQEPPKTRVRGGNFVAPRAAAPVEPAPAQTDKPAEA